MNNSKLYNLLKCYKKNSLIRSQEDTDEYIDHFFSDLDEGIKYGEEYAQHVFKNCNKKESLKILDVGCSHGSLTAGISNHPAVKEIIGVEIESDAVKLAEELVHTNYYKEANKLTFLEGVAEKLPFADQSFDVIFCHTVIEHVADVNKSLSEMTRCLKCGGRLYLSAPNYRWVMEPHIHVPMLPGSPKWLVKMTAYLLKKDNHFVDTLQFVTPTKIEQIFKANHLHFKNIALKKYYDILVKQDLQNLSRKNLNNCLKWLFRLRMGKIIWIIIEKSQIYPSINYVCIKERVSYVKN